MISPSKASGHCRHQGKKWASAMAGNVGQHGQLHGRADQTGLLAPASNDLSGGPRGDSVAGKADHEPAGSQ